ncbi:MAG: phosphate acyltransferase PlsX [Clostridia bacterium]|nr:phosphate acyltransferase PlsX [Clostridia bacterium]
MKIVLDAFGGDYAPEEIIKGACLAIKQTNDISIILTGKQNIISSLLKKYDYDTARITILNANSVITFDEVPTTAIKHKTDSSIVIALETLKHNFDVVGVVSAGSTGALLVGGLLKLGRIAGVSRPALMPVLPTITNSMVGLIDCGANMDCKPINLCHFAVMGSVYMRAIYNVPNPRVALLNIGTEESKGNELTKQTYILLKNSPINFVGNVEARDVLSGQVDLVVSDGFNGNVLLKSSEGMALTVMHMLKKFVKSDFKSKIGAILMKNSFIKLKDKLNYSQYGGAVILGLNGIVIKAHGSSTAGSICTAIKQVVQLNAHNLTQEIKNEIDNINSALKGMVEN